MNAPAMTFAGFGQGGFERARGPGGFEHGALIIAAIDDVVQGAWVLNAQFASHLAK